MRADRPRTRLGVALVAALGVLAPRAAPADPDGVAALRYDPDARGRLPPPILDGSGSPRGPSVLLGPDDRTAPGAAALRAAAETPLTARLSLRAGGRQVGGSAPDAEARVVLHALGAAAHGVRLDLAAGYEGRSFNGVPEAVAAVTLSAPLGTALLTAEATFGRAAGTTERYGDLHVAAVRALGSLQVGVDARATVDLQRDPGDSPAEAEWVISAGPSIRWSHGPLFLRATGGLVEQRLRIVGTRRSGAGATLGIGAVY